MLNILNRIAQADYKTYLKGIQDNSDLVSGTVEEMASELQRKFEALIDDDKEVYEKACKGMLSIRLNLWLSLIYKVAFFLIFERKKFLQLLRVSNYFKSVVCVCLRFK